MFILQHLLSELKSEFNSSKKSKERGIWFIYTIMAIIIPFTSSKTSNLLRCLETLFGFKDITKRRYYTFMASPLIPWKQLWGRLWKLIPEPLTDNRLILVLDDTINPKTGRKIFGCYNFFDHAAKQNQSKFPWSQNIVQVGLLKRIKDRWACLPLAFRFYHLARELKKVKISKRPVEFQSKMEQSVEMISEIHRQFQQPIIVVTDSWYGNNGLWKPLRQQIGQEIHLVSRLRANANLFDLPSVSRKKVRGRPRKYGKKLGITSTHAVKAKEQAKEYKVNLYSKTRTITAHEQIVMLKTLKCPVRVVWVFRKTQWIAMFSTDLTLSVEQIVEYYGARWKIESGFKELKHDLGSAETQTRNQNAVTNHLQFCMMAGTVTWIYANQLKKIPDRRHSVTGRTHYAFSDVRRLMAKVICDDDFNKVFPIPQKTSIKSLIATMLRMAA
jgi:IS4 transposase